MASERKIERKAYYTRKIKRAVHLLFFKRHFKPGIKGWELKRELGSDYPKVIELLNDYLSRLDLQVKVLSKDGKVVTLKELNSEQLNKSIFYVSLKGELTLTEAKMIGWRIDDIAGLAITIAYIISKGGKAKREEVEKLLNEKLPNWKVKLNLDRYAHAGYITQDEKEWLYLDWRTRAEVDEKSLADLILKAESENSTVSQSTINNHDKGSKDNPK